MSVITEEWLQEAEARLKALDCAGERWAAEMAAKAAMDGAARANWVAQRAMKQFTGGHYLCPGPVAGVKCCSRHGRHHYSPDYKGKDWKCCDCRCLKDKFIVAKHSRLSAKSEPWFPRSA